MWYPRNVKIIPKKFSLSPTTLLHWFIGDGSANSEIPFSTHNFTSNNVDYIVKLINSTLDISSHWRFQKRKKKSNQPVIIIGRQRDIKRFYSYLNQANDETIEIAKKVFPWKFDTNLRKRDVMRLRSYRSELFRNLDTYDHLGPLLLETIEKFYSEKV